MKKVLLSFIAIGYCLTIVSQIPESFNYQVIPRNGSGSIYPGKAINVRISILSGSPEGSSVYTETLNANTNNSGLLNLQIGQGTPVSGTFSAISWETGSFYLKVEIDPSGGSSYTDIVTTEILSVPYDMPSKTSKKTSLIVIEDELFISRKFVGKFLDYRQTGPKTDSGPNLIWIKTSMDNTFGKISAYGKKCEFSVGDKLYIKRTYYTPGGFSGYWVYQIENDSSIYYRVSDFQYDHKVLVETWF